MYLKPILIPGLKTQMTKDLLNYLLEQCRAWMLPEEIRALRRCSLVKSGEEKLKASSITNPDLEKLYGFTDFKTNRLGVLVSRNVKSVKRLKMKVHLYILSSSSEVRF